jgi:hypothetical protein
MARLEKDQFEKYLEQNSPKEEPSEMIFQNLQQAAKWDQKPNYHSKVALVLIVAIIGFLLITTSDSQKAPNNAKNKQEDNTPIPEFQPYKSEPIDIIASKDIIPGSGLYKFMKYKNEDFNLSFGDDRLAIEMLSNSAELDNI